MTMHRAMFFIMLATATWAPAGEWPQWRGPFMNGTTDETNLPTTWSRTENIAWSVDLPGAAAAVDDQAVGAGDPRLAGDNRRTPRSRCASRRSCSSPVPTTSVPSTRRNRSGVGGATPTASSKPTVQSGARRRV